MTYLDGRKFVGMFNDGKMEGTGKMSYPDGKAEEGPWKDNKFAGVVATAPAVSTAAVTTAAARSTTTAVSTASAESSVLSQMDRQILESACLAFHQAHHQEDEQAGGVAGLVEFTGYKVASMHVDAGETVIGIKVVGQKSLAHDAQWASTGKLDWQERWRSGDDGWVLVGRMNKPSGIAIVR
jgi:hypothetical protein